MHASTDFLHSAAAQAAPDAQSLKHALINLLVYATGKDPDTATARDWFFSAAHTTRGLIVERWMETLRSHRRRDSKQVYYLSMEFLMGRALMNGLYNVGCESAFAQALAEIGPDWREVRDIEQDPALGNGGLGRLAACFLDSMATLDLPGYGYGIRYEYGMFTQKVENGWQIEHPDNWLRYGNPWEFPRPEVLYAVKFNGRVAYSVDAQGNYQPQWVDTDEVMAMAYDTLIPGYATATVNTLRLWSAKASRDFDLQRFNEGDYIQAVADKNASENISKVLYPNDATEHGRELRLKQQYFFASASLQDILVRYRQNHDDWAALPDKAAIQLNDTHPSIAVAELMRLLMDVHHLSWDYAWSLTQRTFAYTNHTLMPEALETWSVALFERLLPRHLQIIYEINDRFLKEVGRRFPGDRNLLKRLSLIDEEHGRRVRMAHLAVVGSHTVNGVAAIHTQLLRETLFADFQRVWPDKIINITNGITPRRWLNQANPELAHLISATIGTDWLTDLQQLQHLAPFAENPQFRQSFRAIKYANKVRLAQLIERRLHVRVNPNSLFDVQVKRIHEYKRQLLNVLHVITLYNRIRAKPQEDYVPRTVLFSGKAAPGYRIAKLVIKLINDVAACINQDPLVADRLKVIFIPNYDVSTAEDIIPAADLSEQISTAGTEASGTGNMKLALNGALTIGTLDGANIEMRDAVGADNFFIFGLTTREVSELRARGYNPWDYYHSNTELQQALDLIGSGFFSPDEPSRHRALVDNLTHQGDPFLLLADYADYIACQARVEALYRDPEAWTRRAILNVARMGGFSSDRAVREYAECIWQTHALEQRQRTRDV